MSENNFVHSFLSDLFNDPRMKRRYGESLIDSLLAESLNLSYFNGEKLTLEDADYGWFRAVNGRIEFNDDLRYGTVMNNLNGHIHRPVCVRKVDGEYWVASQLKAIARFDSRWNFLGEWGEYGDMGNAIEEYSDVHKFMADEENRRLYILSKKKHVVRVFDLDTHERLFDIGEPGVLGSPEDVKLHSPEDILRMPSGHILIACSGDNGFAARYEIADEETKAQYIDTPLSYKENGHPERGDQYSGEIEHPVVLKGRENENGDYQVFVGYYPSDGIEHKIAVFDLEPNGEDPEVFKFSFLYNSPTVGSSQHPFRFDLDEDYMYVSFYFKHPVTNSMTAGIHAIDLKTNSKVGRFIGSPSNDDLRYNALGTLAKIKDVYLDINPEDSRKNKIILTDYDCEHIQEFYPEQAADRPIEIQYRKPEGHGGVFSPLDLDGNGKAKVSWQSIVDGTLPTEIWRIFP